MNTAPAHGPLGLPLWAWAAPIAGVALAVAKLAHFELSWFIVAPILVAAVLAAVHHAEVIAHRIGEPYGTLVLAIAVTTIEVGLIVSMMIAGGAASGALARDTVFAAVMIIMNGIIGVSLLAAGARHREPEFNQSGINAALTVLTALMVLTMLLPNVSSAPGPHYSNGQLAFVAVVSLILYLTFVFTQTVRHRDYFLFDGDDASMEKLISRQMALTSLGLLAAALVGVVTAGKAMAPTISETVAAAGAPQALVGVIIAAIVLMPEGLAAVRAARANRLQDSLNLALGSALASIGLTIPAVAIVSLSLGFPLTLGLGPRDTYLLILTLFLAVLSLRSGRTTVLNGVVNLVIFAVYLFAVVNP